METSFKIYWNDAALTFCDSFQNKQNSETVIEGDEACRSYLHIITSAIQTLSSSTVLVCSSPAMLYHELRKMVPVVAAGGGVVRNEKGELLMIFRKSRWDLPKGKAEKNESISVTAIREVKEECGLQEVFITDYHPQVTFHFNFLKAKLCIKETFWYKMHAQSSQPLVPQAIENITDIRWADADQADLLLQQSYPLIREVVRPRLL